MTEAIEVQGLRKAYGDVEAVAGVSFSVAAGEVFTLLGPNGAGKTTITEILEGYRARTAGDVRELLELVGLEGKENTRVKLMSGGQRRRLDLALAIVGDPDLLFLDEPTT